MELCVFANQQRTKKFKKAEKFVTKKKKSKVNELNI